MKLVEFDWQPGDRQLRQFSLLCVPAFPLLAWLWGFGEDWAGWAAIFGVMIAVAGLIHPQLVRPLFLTLMLIATPIGMLMGEIILLSIFLLVFVPVSVIFRILGRDALQLKRRPGTTTFWQTKRRPADLLSYYRRF